METRFEIFKFVREQVAKQPTASPQPFKLYFRETRYIDTLMTTAHFQWIADGIYRWSRSAGYATGAQMHMAVGSFGVTSQYADTQSFVLGVHFDAPVATTDISRVEAFGELVGRVGIAQNKTSKP